MKKLSGIREHPEFAYHLLRASLDSFQKNPEMLDGEQRSRVERKARETYAIEDLVMASPEAVGVVITDHQLDRAVSEVQSRYQSAGEFDNDLQRNGLDRMILRNALRRELTFDSVLQKVGSRYASIGSLDVALFYEMHKAKFQWPEKRIARHILVTVNDDYAENRRDVAMARSRQIADKLRGKSNRFASLARRHSECPTAMDGGKLGSVARGQLYPQLERALFALQADQVSAPIESEIGFHILWCERIDPGKKVPLRQAEEQIRATLEKRRQRNCQKAWLSELKQAHSNRVAHNEVA